MNDWKPICRLDEIPVLGARRVARTQGVAVAVFRNADNQVFALLDRCPHKGGPLSQGIVLGDSVACPLHNWTIGLADGCAKQAPYDVIVIEGGVEEVPEALLGQLAEGGRLVAVVLGAGGGFGKGTVFTRIGGAITKRAVFDAGSPLLPGFKKAPSFVF